MTFTDTHFIIAHRLLTEPSKKWTTLHFKNCHRPFVVKFFNDLIDKKILIREKARGRNSFSLLSRPADLLDLCCQNFKNNEEKTFSFVSKRPEKGLITDLLTMDLEFYLGRFTGIKKEWILSTVSDFSLLIPDRKIFYGDALANFQLDYKLLKVSFGGNITLILPRFKEFLRKTAVVQDNMKIPGDFYTYLYLSATNNIIALPQKEHIEKKLRGINGNFLTWK